MSEKQIPTEGDAGPRSLAELEARLARDLALLVVPPAKQWLEPRAHKKWGALLDVAVVGAGMAGLAAAFALRRLGVRNLRLFDRATSGSEGPWVTYARMQTLRSPPELSGPALGLANLTFRAWFEAQFGSEQWRTVHRIPRVQWMAYLRWYRRMIDVDVASQTEVTEITGDSEAVALSVRSAAGVRRIAARRVVLATGRDGLGGPYVPEVFHGLDKRYWAHASEDIDFAALRGKTVGVIGAGASAVDNAAETLEAGARRVAMLMRRADVPRVNRGMGIGSPGMWHGFYRLSCEERWSIVQHIADRAIPPPRDSMRRCSRHANFSIIARCASLNADIAGDRVRLLTSRGELVFDYLIVCTGFRVDWQRRPELEALASRVLLWGDRFAPANGDAFEQADHPFLGADLEFLEKQPNASPWVTRVHCFTFPAFMSHGPITGDVPAISVGAERVATGIAARLFAEDYERNWARLLAWDTPELTAEDYAIDEEIAKFRAKPVIEGA
jgi:FAD-dependent urate hydroxylase